MVALIVRDREPGTVGVHNELPGFGLATGPTEGGMPLLAGRFAVFDQWARIDSAAEGTFMERVAPGAFLRTIREDRTNMRILFNHGNDPYIGSKPLAAIELLGEDPMGAHYAGRLFDADYARALLPALRAGQFGSSFRFRVERDERREYPGRAAHNPDGIPERTIREARVLEFGPVTFPAYAGATAGTRHKPTVPVRRFRNHQEFVDWITR